MTSATSSGRAVLSPTSLMWPVLVGTALLLPFGTVQLSATVSFMPALISVVACFDVISVCLLLGGYRDKGDVRLLLMAAAYAFSLVVMAGYALAFPGAVSQTPPLATSASVAPYLYVVWHGGFPLLLGLAVAPWPGRLSRSTPDAKRTLRSVQALALAAGTAAAVVAVVAGDTVHLPVLIVGLDTHRMTTLTAPVVLPVVLASLVAAWLGTRGRSGPEAWCTLTIMVCACDLVLTYSSGSRFSLGWYGGRGLTLLAAGTVLVAMLSSFRRLSSEAEHNAAHDLLTGLPNRRSIRESLEQHTALARRTGRPLGVVSMDLDHFKSVNDTHGHAAGDLVLAAVGGVLQGTARASDVVARVGGEEFLVLLPDTDLDGALAAAEHLRRAVAGLRLPGIGRPLSASLGTTTLQTGDHDVDTLLRRADEALYAAKHGGRDRVVAAGDQSGGRLLKVVLPRSAGTSTEEYRNGRAGPGA